MGSVSYRDQFAGGQGGHEAQAEEPSRNRKILELNRRMRLEIMRHRQTCFARRKEYAKNLDIDFHT